MRRTTWVSVGLGSVALLLSVSARAQCSMDTECKGERICEQGRCVDPPVPAPAALAAPPAPVVVAPVAPPALPPEEPAPPKMVRHSKGMMAGGIVMTALAPVALIVSGTAALSQSVCGWGDDSSYYGDRCDYDGVIYGSLVVGAVLLGVGIPLIVIGSKKEPESEHLSATVTPWATPSAAGLGVRVEL
ncbi:MAG: putative rane protein [Polyangiaceae bacterium]|jgi:hypothetical protein|nr:putative rane protein [Polyangiaceae bacterium]